MSALNRRAFLTTTAAAAVAPALPTPVVSAAPVIGIDHVQRVADALTANFTAMFDDAMFCGTATFSTKPGAVNRVDPRKFYFP